MAYRVMDHPANQQARASVQNGIGMVRYKRDHANENHQLMIAVSKHWYITRDGCLQWQMKPMEIDLRTCGASDRIHVVNYIIRDHYSGLFFAAVSRSDEQRSAEDFLTEAWSTKAEHPLVGPPEHLCVAKTCLAAFPMLAEFLREHKVRILDATSGFQSGIRDAQTWNSCLDYASMLTERHGYRATFSAVSAQTTRLSYKACSAKQHRPSRIEPYQYSLAQKQSVTPAMI